MRQGYASSHPTLRFLAPDNSYSCQAVQGCKDPQDMISIKFGQNAPFRIAHRKHLGQHQFYQYPVRIEERAEVSILAHVRPMQCIVFFAA